MQAEERDQVADVERVRRTGRSRCRRRSGARSRAARAAPVSSRGACRATRARREPASPVITVLRASHGLQAGVTGGRRSAAALRSEATLASIGPRPSAIHPMVSSRPPCRPASRGGNANAGTATGTARGDAAVAAKAAHRPPPVPVLTFLIVGCHRGSPARSARTAYFVAGPGRAQGGPRQPRPSPSSRRSYDRSGDRSSSRGSATIAARS